MVDKVSAAVKKTLEDPTVKKRIEDTGSLIVANTPEQFAAQIAAEFEVYKKVVDDSRSSTLRVTARALTLPGALDQPRAARRSTASSTRCGSRTAWRRTRWPPTGAT